MIKLNRLQIIVLCSVFIILFLIFFGFIVYKIIKAKEPIDFPKNDNPLSTWRF